jgi:hypothetical protein
MLDDDDDDDDLENIVCEHTRKKIKEKEKKKIPVAIARNN